MSADAAGRLAAARERPAAAPVRAAVPKTTRVSVDLEPASYSTLVNFGVRVAYERALPPVHRVNIFRALLAELEEDPELAERVSRRLEELA